MTATTFTPAPASTTAPRPPFTRASADRLFWRQEWTRHWPLWVNGLALWIWLFLVPGQTTEESQVLRWSILWTGALALVLAGDDLRRGIDPLVRGLPLDPRRRWQMRTAAVLVGGSLFYLAGCVASGERWAYHLWHHVASGPFSGLPATSDPSPFQPWQGLGVLALVALLCCLAAAHYHGMFMGLVYAGGVWLASHGCSGHYPVLLSEWDMTGSAPSRFIDYGRRANTLGMACAAFAALFWIIGTLHSSRRAPILTRGQSISFLSLIVTLTGGIAILQLLLLTFFNRHAGIHQLLSVGASSLNGRVLSFEDVKALSTLRWWTGLTWLEALLFVAWWLARHRAEHPGGGETAASLKPRWLPWLAGVVTVCHLFTQPLQILHTRAPELAQPWPLPIPNPTVTTSQSWAQASNNPSYAITPNAYDAFLVAWYLSGSRPEPIVLQSSSLAIPSVWPAITSLKFTVPPNPLWPRPQVLEFQLSRPPSHSESSSVESRNSHLWLRLAPSVLFGNDGWSGPSTLLDTAPLQANFASRQFQPEAFYTHRPEATNRPAMMWALFLVPQRPGEAPTERPWIDIANLESRSFPFPVHTPGSFEKSGILGLDEALTSHRRLPSCYWLLPFALLGGLLLLHNRFGGACLLMICLLLLFAMIRADASRIQTELRITKDPTYPSCQRDLARAKASTSFFHDRPDQPDR